MLSEEQNTPKSVNVSCVIIVSTLPGKLYQTKKEKKGENEIAVFLLLGHNQRYRPIMLERSV